MNPERQSGAIRIEGGSAEAKQRALAQLRALFENQERPEFEREKTPEERNIVDAILKRFPAFVEHYGGSVPSFTPEHVHIWDVRDFDEQQRKDWNAAHPDEYGFYNRAYQKIVVISEGKRLRDAHAMTHELIHASSFQSYTINEEQRSIAFRRLGIEVTNRKDSKEDFELLNEAVTEELTRRFAEKYFSEIPELAEELAVRDRTRARLGGNSDSAAEVQSVFIEKLAEGDFKSTIYAYAYSDARNELRSLIDAVYGKNKKTFESREQVFDMFARAVFTGKLLNVAHAIEGLGEKGIFRKLGEATRKKPREL